MTAKDRAVTRIRELTGVEVRADALMDVQIKRIHEYKRQLLNILGIIYRYDRIKNMSPQERKKVGLPAPRGTFTMCCLEGSSLCLHGLCSSRSGCGSGVCCSSWCANHPRLVASKTFQ